MMRLYFGLYTFTDVSSLQTTNQAEEEEEDPEAMRRQLDALLQD
jgi:hypothetical protein